MHRVAVLGICLCLWVRVAEGTGIPVYDALNHASNTTTSLQTFISAVQNVLQTGYMVMELTGVKEVLGAAEMLEDLALLSALLKDAQAIANDRKSIHQQVARLFDLKNAPNNTTDWQKRQQEINTTLYEVYSYATQTQTLIATVVRMVQNVQRFIARIGVLVGNRQALQSINESQAQLLLAQQKQAVMTTAFQRAEAYQRLQEPLERETTRRIEEAIMEDYPK